MDKKNKVVYTIFKRNNKFNKKKKSTNAFARQKTVNVDKAKTI